MTEEGIEKCAYCGHEFYEGEGEFDSSGQCSDCRTYEQEEEE